MVLVSPKEVLTVVSVPCCARKVVGVLDLPGGRAVLCTSLAKVELFE